MCRRVTFLSLSARKAVPGEQVAHLKGRSSNQCRLLIMCIELHIGPSALFQLGLITVLISAV